MKIRNIPYGYKYVNGEIVTDNKAEQIITGICRAYLAGESLLTIAERLNRQGVEYRDGVAGWNKARIKRIIEDERYLGNKGYPQIISDEIYAKIEQIRKMKNEQFFAKAPPALQLDVPIRCPFCHSELHRKYESRRKNKVRWRCKNERCKIFIPKADEELQKEITVILNSLIANPNAINSPECELTNSSEEVQICSGEIARLFDETVIDKERLQQKLLESAAANYGQILSGNIRTQLLKDIFARASQTEEFPEELFRRTADEIVLHTDGSVEIILINKQGVKA